MHGQQNIKITHMSTYKSVFETRVFPYTLHEGILGDWNYRSVHS